MRQSAAKRKFLLTSGDWEKTECRRVKKGYLFDRPCLYTSVTKDERGSSLKLRIQIETNIKTEVVPISDADAEQLLSMCEGRVLVFDLYEYFCDGQKWKICSYENGERPTVIGETHDIDGQDWPIWVSEEVTANKSFCDIEMSLAGNSIDCQRVV